MREKLIELMQNKEACIDMGIESCDDCPYGQVADCYTHALADHLIANGVTIPVRCKECKHWLYEFDDVGLCFTDVPDIEGVQRHADDFCSYGERRTDDETAGENHPGIR